MRCVRCRCVRFRASACCGALHLLVDETQDPPDPCAVSLSGGALAVCAGRRAAASQRIPKPNGHVCLPRLTRSTPPMPPSPSSGPKSAGTSAMGSKA